MVTRDSPPGPPPSTLPAAGRHWRGALLPGVPPMSGGEGPSSPCVRYERTGGRAFLTVSGGRARQVREPFWPPLPALIYVPLETGRPSGNSWLAIPAVTSPASGPAGRP